ncbi:protein TPX2 [Cornus florida]|uniref:protein TPX2 n=1 Tax=Cornus florida TaxID=4283 RepID=UPI0028A196CE|nr:protein TPX2 [Cornus florida]
MNKPQVLQKVQQELDAVIGKDNIVEKSHIHQLPYLYAVMKEVLRLHPALPLLIKEKEIMYKRYREEAESEKMMEEEKALKQLRRTLVPHAWPVPKFNHPFIPQKSSKEITKPKSPKLKMVQRKERRKMFSTVAASSAASLMR